MKRSDVADLFFSCADEWLAAFDRHRVDSPDRVEHLLQLIEREAAEPRRLFAEASEGPDDPTPDQVKAIRGAIASLVKLGAGAAALLVEAPIDKKDVGELVVIAGKKH